LILRASHSPQIEGAKTLYSGLHRPNGLAFANGALYIAELAKISKVEKIEDNLDNSPKPVVIYDDLPKDEAHGSYRRILVTEGIRRQRFELAI